MKAKSSPTIKQAVLKEFAKLPDTFRGKDLGRLGKIVTRRKFIHTDTPLRKMRVLKAEGKINYTLAGCREESLYQKL
jgi:hypothetical protein